MFCKYEKMMKILNSEIELTHDLFLEALEMSKTAIDEKDRKEVMRFANDCHCRFVALKELRRKFWKRQRLNTASLLFRHGSLDLSAIMV